MPLSASVRKATNESTLNTASWALICERSHWLAGAGAKAPSGSSQSRSVQGTSRRASR